MTKHDVDEMKKISKNIVDLESELNKLKDLQSKLIKLIGPGILPNYPMQISIIGEKVPHLSSITEFLQTLNDRVNGM